MQVHRLQKELEALQPVLAKSQKDTADLMEVIQKRLPGVEETRAVRWGARANPQPPSPTTPTHSLFFLRAWLCIPTCLLSWLLCACMFGCVSLQVVKRDADIANGEAEKVQATKQECEDDLAVAMPILESALKVRTCTSGARPVLPTTHHPLLLHIGMDGHLVYVCHVCFGLWQALDTLSPSDITNLKAMKAPPAGVKLVMTAVCVMLDAKPDRVPDPSGSGKVGSTTGGKRTTSLMSV